MLSEGQKFGEKERYELIKQLGRGGFSEVWLAEDSWTHVQVAIKVYAPGAGLDEAGIQLFTQEFSLVFDMNHTNLLKPTYFDSYERQPYLIMPLCKNGSAFKYVAAKESIPEEECWKMLHDVAAGLAYLHGKNPPVIHQDIKPDNILISDEGRYMITDFGISARVRSTIRSGSAASEQSGGTLAYMGPERFSSQPRPIMASDVWSLGAMMYELICGMPPFGNNGGLMQKKGAEIPIIEENYSQELKDIIYSCLLEVPGKRPWAKTIEELAYNHLHGITMPQAAEPVQAIQNEPVVEPAPQPEPVPEPVYQAEPVYQPEPQPEPAYQAQPQPEPQPAPVAEPEPAPVQRTAQPEPASWKPQNSAGTKKSGSSSPLANKKLLIAAAVVGVLLIVGLASMCGGGDEETAQVAEVEQVAPQVNLDSIAQLKLAVTRDAMKKADEFQANFSEQLLNPENGKLEDFYIDIIEKCREYKAEADQYPDSQLKDAALELEMQTQQTEAENHLYDIYKMLENDIKALLKIGSKDMADKYQERANTIKPYIEEKLQEQPAAEQPETEQSKQEAE
ncbi:MAG: serine/threonine protein kinase [Prevotella sp.]|nr:serine/threonine protein kinase [Prevotella sp.]